MFGNIDKSGYLDGPIQNALFYPIDAIMDKKEIFGFLTLEKMQLEK